MTSRLRYGRAPPSADAATRASPSRARTNPPPGRTGPGRRTEPRLEPRDLSIANRIPVMALHRAGQGRADARPLRHDLVAIDVDPIEGDRHAAVGRFERRAQPPDDLWPAGMRGRRA